MNFNLIPHDPESYKVYADYLEEQGFLLTNAIRNKILPLDIENGDGKGLASAINNFPNYGHGFGNNWRGFGDSHGQGWCNGSGKDGNGLGRCHNENCVE